MEQGKRYRVTGWSNLYPKQTMTVWVDTVTEQELENYYHLKWALAILRRIEQGQGRHDWELPYAIRRLERLQENTTDK